MTWCAGWTISPPDPQSTYWPSGIAGWPFRAIGNPLNDGTWTYTWQNGRQLQKMQKSGETVEFVYNENGLRVQKTATSTGETKYTLHGKNIVHLAQGSNELHFFYDAQNKPAVVVYNGTPYSYVKNLQGDIVAILDSNKNVVVSYVYDAWGRPISKNGSMAATLGIVQPFRYRSYVYDEEAGLYYLRSRYYSPYTCRFINADVLQLGNLFAYCANSPIIHGDRTGYAMVCCLDENGNEAIFSPMTMGGMMGGGVACAMIVAKETSPEEVEQFVEESIDGAVQGMVESLPGAKLMKLLHYNRNIFNQEYSEAYLTDVLNLVPLPASKAKLHQNNLVKGEPNRKYVIGEWLSSEQVYFSDGRVNNTPEDQGTFNVYSGDNWLLNIIVHGGYDVIPYMFWGNSPDDSTTIIDRLEMGIK